MNVHKDLHNNVRAMRVLSPVAVGANGTASGKVIDRQGYGGVQFILSYGAITTSGSTVTPVVKEGDATGSLTSVADADLLGTETLAALAAGARASGTTMHVVKRVGYKGTKRYVTVDMVKAGTTSAGAIAVNAVLFNPEVAPTSNP